MSLLVDKLTFYMTQKLYFLYVIIRAHWKDTEETDGEDKWEQNKVERRSF